MAEISFTIPLAPRGQARARSSVICGHAHTYKSGKQRLEEDKLAALVAPHCPPVPWTGAVELQVTAYLPLPSAWSRKKKEMALGGRIPYVKKPDLDNIVKHLKDVLSGMVYVDDKQITYINAVKCYGEPPRWVVTVREVAA